MADLKRVYAAADESSAHDALDEFAAKGTKSIQRFQNLGTKIDLHVNRL